MWADQLPDSLTRLVTPLAVRVYAEGLGWQRVEGVNGKIAVYKNPDSPLRQLIVPLDEQVAVHRCCCGYPRHSQGKEPCAKSRKRLLWRLITVIPLTARLNGFGRESAAMTPRLFRPRAGVG